MIDLDDHDAEQKIWDQYRQSGPLQFSSDGRVSKITGLLVGWDDEDSSKDKEVCFWAGYECDGSLSDQCNIPAHELEKLCPGFNIEWNVAESTHCVTVPLGKAPEVLIQIGDQFKKHGFLE